MRKNFHDSKVLSRWCVNPGFTYGMNKDQHQLQNTYTSASTRQQFIISSHIDSRSGSEARRRCAIFASFSRPVTHHLAVNGATHTIVQLCIQLWQSISCTLANKPNNFHCNANAMQIVAYVVKIWAVCTTFS